MQHLTPGAVVVRTFGGVRALARRLNVEPSTVSRWHSSGRVPSSWQRRVIELAWKEGLDLTAHDLVFGRSHA